MVLITAVVLSGVSLVVLPLWELPQALIAIITGVIVCKLIAAINGRISKRRFEYVRDTGNSTER
jgi:hypothetical protein